MPRDDCHFFKKYGAHGKVIAVDLDGTLCVNKFPEVGKPLPGVVERMRRLKQLGCYIIIHTARINPLYNDTFGEQVGKIHCALAEYGIPYDEIWMEEGKPLACHMIDDKAFRTVAALLDHLERE